MPESIGLRPPAWVSPTIATWDANRDCFRRDQSDLDGGFSLRNVVPGTYTIVAIEDGWDLDWAEPAALTGYFKQGQTIEVGSRSQTAMRLADALEVQAK